ncbi:MAG: bifunctional diguanylate cyclase/phosphodiesterase [Desulfuromonadaceae bacterium]|nr:bifunctional diguanylate cyclase/phosphodiesterase [Desulfuromonadaceae bacterium]
MTFYLSVTGFLCFGALLLIWAVYVLLNKEVTLPRAIRSWNLVLLLNGINLVAYCSFLLVYTANTNPTERTFSQVLTFGSYGAVMALLIFFLGTKLSRRSDPAASVRHEMTNGDETSETPSSFYSELASGKSLPDKEGAEEEQVSWLSRHDPLTGLANYHQILSGLERILDNEATKNGWLFLVDVSGLQRINDAYSHRSGDAVLIHIANKIRELTPVFAARLSGSTFLIVDSPSENQPEIYADALMNCIGSTVNDGERMVGIATRICAVQLEGDDAGRILLRAEYAMRSLKQAGKSSGFIAYGAYLEQEDHVKNELIKDLHVALDHPEQIELFYQPIWDIRNGKLKSFECLMRWAHPTMGYVDPNQFIALAEQNSLMVPLGLLAFEISCEKLHQWVKSYISKFNSPFRLSVNMTPQQFATSDFVEGVKMTMEKWNISAHNICIEITETSLMADKELAVERIGLLKNMGCKIAIDDFGVGYSSLSYLQQFDVDIIKIDRSIIKDITTSDSSKKITEAVIKLGHALNIEVIAEGVETSEQLGKLYMLGCDEIQGYIAGKPVPDTSAELWLNNPMCPIDIPERRHKAVSIE